MQTQERAYILKALAGGRDALLDALRGLPDGLATASPASGRWSVVECVEHLAVSEHFLLTAITEARCSEAPVANPKREAAILSRGADRTAPVTSPEAGLPTGRFATLADASAGFLAARERTVRFVETCDDDLRAKAMTHPVMGTINCHEALLLIAVHPRRHAQQILEIGNATG